MGLKMANINKVRLNRLEKKYSKLINECIKRNKDKTMKELWVELDKIKADMKAEMEAKGLNKVEVH